MIPGRDDERIALAHALLVALEPDDVPSLDVIRVGTLTHGIEASTDRGVIVINKRGDFYMRDGIFALALLIHHEHQHASHFADETHALAASYTFCQRHGAPKWLTLRVLAEWRRHQQQEREVSL